MDPTKEKRCRSRQIFIANSFRGHPFPPFFEDNPGPESELSPTELAKITEYLECPTNNGYWRLSGCWLPHGDFSKFIAQSILENYLEAETKPNKKQALERSRLERELIDRIAMKISPLLYFFSYAREHKLGIPHQGAPYGSTYELYIKSVDWNIFCEKFAKALQIFSDSIYYDGFEPILRLGCIVEFTVSFHQPQRVLSA